MFSSLHSRFRGRWMVLLFFVSWVKMLYRVMVQLYYFRHYRPPVAEPCSCYRPPHKGGIKLDIGDTTFRMAVDRDRR